MGVGASQGLPLVSLMGPLTGSPNPIAIISLRPLSDLTLEPYEEATSKQLPSQF